MALILALETSTKSCSVTLAKGSEVLSVREATSDQYIHSEKLHVFIDEVMKEANCSFKDLQAVAVGKGPGSYTGLRIGVSAAKGLCFAIKIPLIAEDGLRLLVHQFLSEKEIQPDEIIIPMLDARRMEVYCSVHNSTGKRLSEIEAKVIDENSFAELKSKRIHLLGDGAAKCKELLKEPRFKYHSLEFPSSTTLALLAQAKFENKAFEDVAYFEPFYLKDFVAGKPKRLL